MKYYIRIEDHTYEVEIPDLQARPLLAIVDGESMEVWPEVSRPVESSAPKAPPVLEKATERHASTSSSPNAKSVLAPAVLAPIPGVIVSILVKEGDEVAYGQDLCIIEAMKMRNAIKAARTGQIAAVRVAPGQTVNHHDVLMEYGE